MFRFEQIFFLLITFYCQSYVTSSSCNLTAFANWVNLNYVGNLKTDATFWRYQTQTAFQLQNSLALKLAFGLCSQNFLALQTFKAGRIGPIDDQTTYTVMCGKYCMEMDLIHQTGIDISGCSCLELSTQAGAPSYTQPGDYCIENSARMQCSLLGFCGVWNCRIDDYMCPRYEYNKRHIEFMGPGSCIIPATAYATTPNVPLYIFTSILGIIYMFYFS